jgi:aminopeptidase
MQREVRDAWFRFEDGEMVEFTAAVGEAVLAQFFEIDGARRLGEVSLVDAGSPIFQSGLLFYEILFDENAACHIAFGEAYPECVEGGAALNREELAALGANFSDTHVDFMIGTATMNVTGLCADGREVPIMRAGRFAPAVLA